MMHIRLRASLKCARHPRFNPRGGLGAVKGGCDICTELCEVQRLIDRLERYFRRFDNELQEVEDRA